MSGVAGAGGPNAQQIEYWNSEASRKWVEHQEALDARIGDFGELAMQRAELAPGHHVLDVGCGCGTTSLELARRVGESGSVLGVDVSGVMLERARARAVEAGLGWLRFANGDAQLHAFEAGGSDRAYSRFGVMFFAQPSEAFANLRRALRPGGRLAFVCWRALAGNDWARIPFEAVAQVVGPPPPPEPGAPGPFALADPERLGGILADAGFDAPEIEPADLEIDLAAGAGLEAAVAFALAAGPASRLLGEADPGRRQEAIGAVREVLAPRADGGRVPLAGQAWLVSASCPR